jgi:hypothetical protein
MKYLIIRIRIVDVQLMATGLTQSPPRVQIYSLCSWFSLMYLDHASIIDLFRDWCVPRWRFPLPFPLDCSHLRPGVLVSTTLATRPFSCTRYAHTRHARHPTPRVSNVYLMHSSSCSSWRSLTNTKTSTRTKKTGCAPAPSLSRPISCVRVGSHNPCPRQ